MASEKKNVKQYRLLSKAVLGLIAVAPWGQGALAQERAELEQLQATTTALIETLVEGGILTPEKASQLMAKARAKAQAAVAAKAQADTRAVMQAQAPAETGPDGKRVVRVPFVPESLKREMREQIKQEVVAQARTERWGEPDAYPSWISRFKPEVDFRFRQEMVRLADNNTAPGSSFTQGDLSRAADISQQASNGLPNFNTQKDFDRSRIRARLGATAALSDAVSGTFRLATGNLTDRTSTNQTLGQSFNKYSVVIDQAYLKLRPWGDQADFSFGRMPNPFFGTDLLWADDLGFEGLAGTARRQLSQSASGFLTAGYFPLSEDKPGSSRSRSLMGIQTGLDMKLDAGSSPNRLQFGAALFNYQGLQGQRETLAAQTSIPDYATRSEYASGLRQRGNTLFNVRAPGDTNAAVYGLASNFRELNVTAALDLPRLLQQPVRLTADFVKNLGYDRAEMSARAGQAVTDGNAYGFLARAQVGKSVMARRGDWNASLTYRYLGSDAVLDAFTNSDFGLGGTNNKGYILGFNYGVYDNTWVTLRWMSSNPVDSYAPGSVSKTRLSVDTFQVELNSRF